MQPYATAASTAASSAHAASENNTMVFNSKNNNSVANNNSNSNNNNVVGGSNPGGDKETAKLRALNATLAEELKVARASAEASAASVKSESRIAENLHADVKAKQQLLVGLVQQDKLNSVYP